MSRARQHAVGSEYRVLVREANWNQTPNFARSHRAKAAHKCAIRSTVPLPSLGTVRRYDVISEAVTRPLCR